MSANLDFWDELMANERPDPAFTDWLIDQELEEAEASCAAPSNDYGTPRSGRRMLPCRPDQDGVL